jgi:hypothetical protein
MTDAVAINAPGFPPYVQIETVATCNARCVMCPVEEWRRSTLLMSDALFTSLIDQLAGQPGKVLRVTPQLDGEPLIDKKIEDRIAALKAIGIPHVEISSNASLLTPERGRRLLDSGLDRISFSMDGASKDTFEAIRRRLDFTECRDNILAFLAMRDRLGSPLEVRIRMTLQDGNIGDYQPFLDFWTRHLGPGDQAYAKFLHNWAGWTPNYTLPPVIDCDRLNRSPCTSPFSSMVILTDGRVPLCCSDFNAGNGWGDATTTPLRDIWNGTKATMARNLHREKGRSGISICVDCNVWDDDATLGKS